MTTKVEVLFDGELHDRFRELTLASRSTLLVVTAVAKRTSIRFPSEVMTFVALAERLLGAGVRVALLTSGDSSRGFISSLAEHSAVQEELALRMCYRNHSKAVLSDNRRLLVSSANLTSAGIGSRVSARRNFEVGFYSEDPLLVQRVSDAAAGIWTGRRCEGCQAVPQCTEEHRRLASALGLAGIELRGWLWPDKILGASSLHMAGSR